MRKNGFVYLILVIFDVETEFDAHAAFAAIGPRLVHWNKRESKLRQSQRG